MRSSFAALDASPGLLDAARRIRPSFNGGAEWLALALGTLRGAPVGARTAHYTFAGVSKYAAATAVGAIGGWTAANLVDVLTGAAATAAGAPPAGPFSVLPKAAAAAFGFAAGFYLAEAPTVYLFPAMIDGERRPWRASFALMRRDGGWIKTAFRTVRIAASMVCGGFLGRGFLRSWCAGCFAVAIRYESLRTAESGEGRP